MRKRKPDPTLLERLNGPLFELSKPQEKTPIVTKFKGTNPEKTTPPDYCPHLRLYPGLDADWCADCRRSIVNW